MSGLVLVCFTFSLFIVFILKTDPAAGGRRGACHVISQLLDCLSDGLNQRLGLDSGEAHVHPIRIPV